MGSRITREEFLEKIYSKKYDELKGKNLRLVNVHVPGKEISLALLIGVAEKRIYENLGLHIGTHAGEDHTGESIGLLHVTPTEAAAIAADIAAKSGVVEIGFLDRFRGSVIILGDRSNVRSALEGVIEFFRYQLNFTVCDIAEE